jgi:hypothetical protein
MRSYQVRRVRPTLKRRVGGVALRFGQHRPQHAYWVAAHFGRVVGKLDDIQTALARLAVGCRGLARVVCVRTVRTAAAAGRAP